jgi:hypothetical protein
MSGRTAQQPLHSSRVRPRPTRRSRSAVVLVSLLAAASVGPVAGVLPVEAAPAASPACDTGYGQAGIGGDGQSSTAGGNGCVVVEYVVSGVTYFETFNYTGALQSWVVPAGAETAKFITYGAGGGGTNTLPKRTSGFDNYRVAVDDANSVSWYSGNEGEGPLPVARDGGAGGSATGTFVVTPGETFSVLVGQGGIGNSDDRCLPVVTRIGPANGDPADLTRGGNPINLWPLNGVPSNTDPAARQGFGGGGRASSFSNTRAFFPIAMTNDYGRDHDECINPYYAAGGGRSEVLRGSTRLVGAGGGGGAGFFGAGGAGAMLASGASASGGDGAGPPFVTNHPVPITVSPTYGSGGTGSAGGAGGLTATVLDNYTGYKTPDTGGYAPFPLPRVNGVAGSAGNGGQAPDGGGGGGGGCFGGGGGGDGGGGGGGSSCNTAPIVTRFMTTSPDGAYTTGGSVGIVAVMSKPIADGAQITVTLDTGETVLLTKTGPYTMSGTYVIGADVSSSDLTVTSYALTSAPVDVDGITMTSLTVPSGTDNIAGSASIVIGPADAPNGSTGTGSTAAGPLLACDPTQPPVGATVTCRIEGADPGIDILWQAYADLASILGGTVQIGADGTAVFTFTVPPAALRRDLSVELVQWGASVRLGIVGGITPVSIPAGEGPTGPARGLPSPAPIILLLLGVTILVRPREAMRFTS